MNKFIAIEDIKPVLAKEVRIPSVVIWNRLEGRPRTQNFDRALKAEVRDALWMLTKQWQMGEFNGDDAGSPVFAKVSMATTRLNKYQADGHSAQPFEDAVPLETKVEQRVVAFKAGSQALSLDLRILMGRQWLKMVGKIADYKSEYVGRYPIAVPDPTRREDALICAHQAVWQMYAATAGRCMDGAALYFYLTQNPTRHAYDGIVTLPEHRLPIDETAARFIAWFEDLIYQPRDSENDAWLPEKLEYQFACSAPSQGTERVFVADEYYHGHLDWYNLDVDRARTTLGAVTDARDPATLQGIINYSSMPAPMQFDGMPNTRWWTFEDGKTNFGDIKPDTTDISKLLLIEFGLVYANDWFQIPFTLPAGTVADVRGMAVTNVFGERFWITPAGAGRDEDWQRWAMYTLSVRGHEDVPAETSLLLLPTVPKIQEGKPMEEVRLIRDEIANMVWGIEARVPLPSGESKPGREAAYELHNHYQRLADKEALGSPTPPAIEYQANIRYQLMTSVPEHWIPFIPVHVENDNREIQLQRAAMPRILVNDPHPPDKIRPRTSLLRAGLDKTVPQAYYLFEEEVPRAGVRVYQSFQRTRWYQGKVFTWLGARKQIGRGEGSSGLAFDRIVPTGKAQS